jgi:multidrug efflux system membrane fusion protein
MDNLNTEVNVPVSRATVRRPPHLRPKLWPRLLWLLFLVLVLAGVGWVVFHPRTAPQVRGGRFSNNGPMPVAMATVEKGDVPVTLNALGTVTPLATVTVRTQINGQLMQVGFKEGDMVNKGDFLAEIDPRPYQATLDQMQGQLLRDQALLKNAQLDVARYRKLVAENSIAQQQRDTQESLVHQLEGTVKADEAQVASAQLNLSYCRILAPVTGRVGLRQVDPGNYVQLSDANGIVVITQTKPISVIFTLPEDTLPAVVKRLRAGATLPVTGFNRTQTTKLATGVLTTVDNQVDTSTGTVKLRAQFDNADESLFPNQFVNAQLLVDTLKDASVVPTAAVQRGAPGTFVYVIKPDDTVAVQPVKLGPTAGERVAVQDGLTPGERVVVDGADKLRDGAKVTLPGANAGAGDGAAGAQQPAAGQGQQGGGQGQQGGRRSRSSP